MRKLDLIKEIDRTVEFISRYIHSAGLENAVLGLSGGIDSSLSAALAARALGKEHVFGAMLPWKHSQDASYNDALTVAEWLGIRHEKIPITPMVEAYFQNYQPHLLPQENVPQDLSCIDSGSAGSASCSTENVLRDLSGRDSGLAGSASCSTPADALRLGNWMARTRMCILYDLSAKYQGLVVGTSNRTELLVGYFTQYGDGACALEPIGHLYKTEVWEMARILGIPKQVIDKTPTADLWAGQTDESELGFTYLRLDEILYALTEQQLDDKELLKSGFQSTELSKARNLMAKTEFKRKLPPLIDDHI
jgi:NAD+ synthase